MQLPKLNQYGKDDVSKVSPVLHNKALILNNKPWSRVAKGRKVSENFGNFPWKVLGILKEWEFLESLGIFNFALSCL